MLVQVIKEVPDDIFDKCLLELSNLQWKDITDDRQQGVFKNSTSIHLRSHNTLHQITPPNSIEAYSSITECINNNNVILNFIGHYKAALWIRDQVHGISLGRIMIVHLEPMSNIGIHTDPGAYFEKYSRYHIPLKTNKSVTFIDKDHNREHMPIKTLCRLNNLGYHGLLNDSTESRIHLIVDVEVAGGNALF